MWRSWDSFDFISFRGDIVARWSKGDRSGGELLVLSVWRAENVIIKYRRRVDRERGRGRDRGMECDQYEYDTHNT